MRNIFLFLMLFPLCASAQLLNADALLDEVVAAMKADAPLQMDYSYTMYDDEGTMVLQDRGVMRLEGNRYALVMDNMGVWCNGKTQWSYMSEIDEIYITDSSSDEAQNLSPLFIVENYRKGCTKEAQLQNGVAVVTLRTPDGSDIESIVLYVDAENNRLKGIDVAMPGQGVMKILLDKYQIKCNFASDVYECPVEKYKTAEVVDMR